MSVVPLSFKCDRQSSEERKSTLEREVMLETEHSDKIKYLNFAKITEKECHDIMKQRADDEKNIFIDTSRKSKWSPGVTDKLKIEQLYLLAQKVEKRLTTLREKNIFSYFEDLTEGRKLDFVIMQLLKSIAGDEFNLEVAKLINQLLKKYQKAKKKGCPSAKVFAVVADTFCNFIDAYKAYYLKHFQEEEEFYKRHKGVEDDESKNLIRKYIYGENFGDNISNIKNVMSLYSQKSMNSWFDKWFKKEIEKYGTQNVGEMIQSVEEILLLREPKIKPVNISFWTALGEYQDIEELKQEGLQTSDKSSGSISSDSKNITTTKKQIETSDTDTDDLCETILASYIDKHEKSEKQLTLQEKSNIGIYNQKQSLQPEFLFEGKEENLEDVFTQEIKKLVKRYGIVNIKDGLINLGMEKYLYNLQKDIGNIECVFFAEEYNRKKREEKTKELLRKRKEIKKKQDLEELDGFHSAGSTTSFHDKVEKALSDYPWELKPKMLNGDLKVMVEALEKELMNCNLKRYPLPQPILAEVEKTASSTEQILPATKDLKKEIKKIVPLIKKSMDGKMEDNQQTLLKNIVLNLILKDQKDTSPAEQEKTFKKLSEGKDAGWNDHNDRLKQLITETYQQKVVGTVLQDYEIEENYLGRQDLKGANELSSTFMDQDNPLETDSELSIEDTNETNISEETDSFMELQKSRGSVGSVGSLLSTEDFTDRKKKLKEYEKKRIEMLNNQKDANEMKDKQVIDCDKVKKNNIFPEMDDSLRDKSWFKEVYYEERDK